MDLDRSAGDFGDGIVHRHRRRNCDAFVELAAAGVVRMAANHVLAGAGTAASLPDSVRRPWCSWFSSFEYAFQDAATHGRAVGANDGGRARKSPSTLGTLRIRAARGQADGVSPGQGGLFNNGMVVPADCNRQFQRLVIPYRERLRLRNAKAAQDGITRPWNEDEGRQGQRQGEER